MYQRCQHLLVGNCNHQLLQQMQLGFWILEGQDKHQTDVDILIRFRAAALSKFDRSIQTAGCDLSSYNIVGIQRVGNGNSYGQGGKSRGPLLFAGNDVFRIAGIHKSLLNQGPAGFSDCFLPISGGYVQLDTFFAELKSVFLIHHSYHLQIQENSPEIRTAWLLERKLLNGT